MVRSFYPLVLAAMLALIFATQSAFALDLEKVFATPCDVEPKGSAPKESPEELFSRALELERKEMWCDAAKLYAEIRRLAPLNPLYRQAQYNLIRALFTLGEYDQTITEAKEFLWLYPTRLEAEEVLYLMGVSFYSDRGTPDTDQDWTSKAQIVFSEYLKKYPEGRYAEKAREMLESSYNELAKKELNVARFYLEREEYVASALRAQGMLRRFRASGYVPEGLCLLVQSFLGLDREKDAAAAIRLLERLHLSSDWTAEAKASYEKFKAEKARN